VRVVLANALSRRAGTLLAVAGAALLSVAGVRYTSGLIKQDRARAEWDATQASMAVAGARLDLPELARGPAAHGSPVARIIIPKIGVDDIVLEGVDEDALNGGPGHFPGSALPGQAGNSVISAHRDRHFHRLGELQLGDTIITETRHHKSTWMVVSKNVIAKDRPALFRANAAELTLTTCWPIQYIGAAPDRLILTARPVGD